MNQYATGQQIPFRYFDQKRPLVVSFRRIHKMTTNNEASITTADIVCIGELRPSRGAQTSSIFHKSPSAKEMRSAIQLESLYDDRRLQKERKKLQSGAAVSFSGCFLQRRRQTTTLDKFSIDATIADNGVHSRSSSLLSSIPDVRVEEKSEEFRRNLIKQGRRNEPSEILRSTKTNQSSPSKSTFDGEINDPMVENETRNEFIHQGESAVGVDPPFTELAQSEATDKLTDQSLMDDFTLRGFSMKQTTKLSKILYEGKDDEFNISLE